MKENFASFHLDFIGFAASLLCAVHCATVPIILISLPYATLAFLHHPAIELAIVFISFCVAVSSLAYSLKKYHRNLIPMYVAIAGFIIIGLGHIMEVEWMKLSFTVIGAVLISVSHFLNWKIVHHSLRSQKSKITSISSSNKLNEIRAYENK